MRTNGASEREPKANEQKPASPEQTYLETIYHLKHFHAPFQLLLAHFVRSYFTFGEIGAP